MIFPKAGRMRDSWREKWRLFWLHSIPLLTTLVLMFLLLIPIDAVKVNYFRPAIGVICVYYWTLKRGYIFGYISAFTVGFFMDTCSSTPLGINMLLMMLTVSVTRWLAHYFQNASFNVGWFIFCLVCLGFMTVKWMILAVYFGQLISLNEIAFNYVATIMFYPLIIAINVQVQKLLPQERINE